jgi:hypothetical protein
MNLGLLVENVEPAITTFHIKRADPARRGNGIVTNGVLRLPIREQRGVLVQHLQFELIKLVTLDRANRAADERDDLGPVRDAAGPDLNMVVREKILEKFAVTIFPSLPGLLLQFDQLFFDRGHVARFGNRAQSVDEKNNHHECNRKGLKFHGTDFLGGTREALGLKTDRSAHQRG